jgi:predicted CDP-diglyceride synthetase/phosphatidate cytidylyltransferase
MTLPIPPIILALALALLLAAPFAFLAGRRGGRFRGMPGWVGFWVFFAGLLVILSRAEVWISFPVLGVLMFVSLRQYFFLAPVRPQDRFAILATYLSIPCALTAAVGDDLGLFFMVVPVGVLLLLPLLLAYGPRQPGLLDSVGRLLLAALVFVFAAAHLGLMAHQPDGRLELFAILVLFAELPQRIAGRPRPGQEVLRPAIGVALALLACTGIGWWLGPLADVTRGQGLTAGALVALAVTAGALVADAVGQDLGLGGASSRFGRGAFLDRAIPALYAAPVCYHYFRYFL